MLDDEIRESLAGTALAFAFAAGRRLRYVAPRQQRHHRGQEQHGIKKGGGDTDGDDVAEIAKWWGIGKVHGQESDYRCNTGQKYGVQVLLYRDRNGVRLAFALVHLVKHRHQDMHTVGNCQRQDDGRRHRRGRVQLQPHPPGCAQAGQHRHQDHHQRGQGAAERAQRDPGDDDEHQKHNRHQDRHIVSGYFAKAVIDHQRAGHVNVDARILLFNIIGELAHELGNFGHLLLRFAGQQDIYVDAGHVT